MFLVDGNSKKVDVTKEAKALAEQGMCIMGYTRDEPARDNCMNICGLSYCQFDKPLPTDKLDATPEEAESLISKYHKKYRRLSEWHARIALLLKLNKINNEVKKP